MAIKIRMREVSVKYTTRKQGEIAKVESPNDAVSAFRRVIIDDSQEQVVCLFLDIANQLLGYSVIGKGSDCESIASVKVAYQKALLVASSRMVLLHNHPSNITDPSEDDYHLTKQFVKAGQFLEIAVLDHIIVGADNYHSLRANEPELFEV